MIVEQYVLGIKVPGRGNSVIFMISGRRARRATKERNGEAATAMAGARWVRREGECGRRRNEGLVNPRRQESSPSFASKRGPSLRLLTRERDDAL